MALFYVSRWSGPEAAAEFAEIYSQSLQQRYKKAEPVGEATADKHPERQAKPEDSEKLPQLTGRHVWTTNEGPVVIEEQGDTVLVSESLDAATTATLEKEVFSK